MKIRTIEDLTMPGDAVRRFTPWGLDTVRQMTPESSARLIQSMVTDCDLAPEIPEHVREHFDLCRTLHTYGIFKEAYSPPRIKAAIPVPIIGHPNMGYIE